MGAAGAIDWQVAPTRAVDSSNPPFYRWFPDGELNITHNALDRHVDAGRGEQPALVYDSPVTATQRTYTYRQLRDEVAAFAGVLAGLGVGKGDRVVIYMPMIPEAVIAMLATARIGAVHSVVFGGFAPKELAIRIDDATPTVIVSASCGIEGTRVIEYHPLLSKAIDLAVHKPAKRVILQRPQATAALGPDDVDWHVALAAATPAAPVAVKATDPLYILYTSGTTGKPKGVVRDCGGYAVALQWSMRNVYDIGAGETTLHRLRCRMGGRAFLHRVRTTACRSDHRVVRGQTGRHPGRRAILAGGRRPPREGHLHRPHRVPGHQERRPERRIARTVMTCPDLKYLFLAGERLDPETYRWASELLGIPVIDHWWQTESGLAHCR